MSINHQKSANNKKYIDAKPTVIFENAANSATEKMACYHHKRSDSPKYLNVIDFALHYYHKYKYFERFYH
ncbi:hypothetical protein BN134_2466 [Cronobacter dublinensis 1210]|uniref:Uncharacterized protein n=1 Tax=Cronobacter dublinensis 1210 TaxID=1208656 RepID=A0ABP1WBE7_9ENTR|nr:hypothetical protein BN134_2466 [Cronobacter dublinensis 1210]